MSVRSTFFALMGDERCSAKVASIAALCGTNIGTAFSPSPLMCATLATLLISILPLAIVPFMPTPAPGAKMNSAQPILLCFASGGLLGDVFLHILPEAFGGGHGHGHSHALEHHHEHHEQPVRVPESFSSRTLSGALQDSR